jgi:hypothetical protein
MLCSTNDKMAARLMLYRGWAVSAAIIEEKWRVRAAGLQGQGGWLAVSAPDDSVALFERSRFRRRAWHAAPMREV